MDQSLKLSDLPSSVPAQSRGMSLIAIVAGAQAVYYILTGVWPLVHIRSFMAVTGPKTDLWLARTTGAAISPLFVGFMFARPSLISMPFYVAGTLKIVYDLLLYREFVSVRPPEEHS